MGNALYRAYGETMVSTKSLGEEGFLKEIFNFIKKFLNKSIKNFYGLFERLKSTNKEQQ